MQSRLFKKFFLTTSVIFIAGITFLSAILGVVFANFYVNNIRDGLYNNCVAVNEAYDGGNEVGKGPFFGLTAALASTSDAEIFLTDISGRVFMCTCEDWRENGFCEFSKALVPRSVLDGILKNGTYYEDGKMSDFFGNTHYFTSALPLKNSNGDLVAFVFSVAPTSQITRFFLMLLRMYILAAIIPIVLIFFAEYALTYRLTRPLKQMSDAAKRMAKGDFSRRIPVISDDEIGDLSISFNNMTNSLVQLESMRRSFIGNVSHELRTPMTTIGGFIDGILDGTIDKDMQGHYLAIVSEEIKRLSRLVESMLCLAKLESGEQKINPQKFDIFKITRNIVVSQEKRLSEKNVEIIGLDEGELTLTADYDLIYQVIFNLTDNAIKFVDNGGKIIFSIESDAAGVTFSIKNTGSFIEKDELNVIFDRFYKVDKSRSVNKNGTGLGLYISKTIIEIHGGTITANSREDDYTEFSFRINNTN